TLLVGGVHQDVERIQVVVHHLMPQVRQLRLDAGNQALEQLPSGRLKREARQLLKEPAHMSRVTHVPDDRSACCRVIEVAKRERQSSSGTATGGALPPGSSRRTE